MSRQAYFYRVPPQELHRRTQLQPEPAKTKALQTVIEMKVWSLHLSLDVIFTAWCCVLGMAGMELIFPLAACLMLRFERQTGNSVGNVLLSSRAYTESKLSQFFCPAPTLQVGLGWRRGWEGAQRAQLTQIHQRDNPYPRVMLSLCKRKGGHSESQRLSS